MAVVAHGTEAIVRTRASAVQVPQIKEFEIGLANIWIMHTSASLTINENASPDVPLDLADALDRLAPEGTKHRYRHDDEGPDVRSRHPFAWLQILCAFSVAHKSGSQLALHQSAK